MFKTISISLVPNMLGKTPLRSLMTSAWILSDHFCICRKNPYWLCSYLCTLWSLQQQELLGTARLSTQGVNPGSWLICTTSGVHQFICAQHELPGAISSTVQNFQSCNSQWLCVSLHCRDKLGGSWTTPGSDDQGTCRHSLEAELHCSWFSCWNHNY